MTNLEARNGSCSYPERDLFLAKNDSFLSKKCLIFEQEMGHF